MYNNCKGKIVDGENMVMNDLKFSSMILRQSKPAFAGRLFEEGLF